MRLRLRLAALTLTLGLALSLVAPPGAQAAEAGPGRAIRVGLGTTLTQVQLSADGAYTLVNLASGAPVLDGSAGQAVTIQVNQAGLAVAGVGTFTGPLRLQPAAGSDGQPGIARSGSKRYRGVLEVSRNAAGLITLVNELDLEDYLPGVVPREMPPSFPAEALKTQAVAARTYALYQMQNSKFAGQGFDVVDTVDSQVYGGVNSEDARSNAAVQATRNQVIVYGGQVINAMFFASGGGHTENNENVFTASVPYLKGVPDYDQESPKYNWTVTLPLVEMQKTLAGKGMDVGTVYGLEPAGPRGVSGRWTTLALVGSKGRLEVKASQLRLALGLNSTLFDIVPHQEGMQAVQVPLAADQPVTALAAGGQVATVSPGQAVVQGAGGTRLSLAGQPAVAVGKQLVPASLELVGHGWGHGVGLSQWGARGMANSGHTFDDILRHYYQGTSVEPRPDLAVSN